MNRWHALAFGYHIASRLAYTIGTGILLKKQESEQTFTRDVGVELGFERFRRIAKTLMVNDAVGFFLLCVFTWHTLHSTVSPWILIPLGWVLVVAGIGTKVWAARRLGSKGYYWHNFFDPTDPVAVDPPGPYRFLENPMYTLGYSHMYGTALVFSSWYGLVAAAFDQIAMLIFYYVVEKPHYDRLTRTHLRG